MILYHALIYLKYHFTAFLHDFIIRLVVLDPYTATEDAAQRPCQTLCLAFSPLMIWVENWPMDFWIPHDFPLTSRKKGPEKNCPACARNSKLVLSAMWVSNVHLILTADGK